ncbi:hypothetical protein RIF29_39862 [Crotalaria pallida]|uniref:Uncharacterized protein n=1 Tax=Crotalaria pallida TaxID=3830 RepID=A0AAN9E8C4_CROPI
MAKKKKQETGNSQETQRNDQRKKVTQETQKTSFKNAIPAQASPKAKDIHGKLSGINPPFRVPGGTVMADGWSRNGWSGDGWSGDDDRSK